MTFWTRNDHLQEWNEVPYPYYSAPCSFYSIFATRGCGLWTLVTWVKQWLYVLVNACTVCWYILTAPVISITLIIIGVVVSVVTSGILDLKSLLAYHSERNCFVCFPALLKVPSASELFLKILMRRSHARCQDLFLRFRLGRVSATGNFIISHKSNLRFSIPCLFYEINKALCRHNLIVFCRLARETSFGQW